MRLVIRFVLLAGLVAMTPGTSLAQLDTATILGTLTDAQGVLPGATVTARNLDTGFTRSGVTDEEGRYRIAAVPPGNSKLLERKN